MDPLVELRIKNNVPQLILHNSEDVQKNMTLEGENLLDLALNAGKTLNLIPENAEHNQENFESLLQLARESDETFFGDFPVIDDTTIEFNLAETLAPLLTQIIDSQEDYSDLQMTDEVKEELAKIQNADTFASFMEAAYNIMIVKTLLAASELGIGNIRLNDDFKNPRLMEKMAKELDKLGIELMIPVAED